MGSEMCIRDRGDTALGGSIESDGPVLYKEHVLINSGYQFGARMPGNALMVFSLPPKADLARGTRNE